MFKSVMKFFSVVLCVFLLSSCSKEVSKPTEDAPVVLPKATIMYEIGPKLHINEESDESYYIDSMNNLWSWGSNREFDDGDDKKMNNVCQLGLECTDDQLTPYKILENVVHVETHFYGGFALKNDGTLWAWGENNFGVLGTGSKANEELPVKVLDNVVYFNVENILVYAIKDDYSLWTWGADKEFNPPKQILDNVKFIDTNSDYISYIIKTDNSLWRIDRFSNEKKILDNVDFVTTAWENTLAIKKDKTMWIWGLWDDSADRRIYYSEPTMVLEDVSKAFIDNNSYFALKSNGDLYAWGSNWDVMDEGYNLSSEGIFDRTIHPIDEPVNILNDVVDMKQTRYFLNAVLKEDNTLWAWGGDSQEGFGFNEYYPTKIFENVQTFALGSPAPRFGLGHVIVSTLDGKLYAMGRNSVGQLGNGTRKSSEKFIEIKYGE